jgi:hypothetical protein
MTILTYVADDDMSLWTNINIDEFNQKNLFFFAAKGVGEGGLCRFCRFSMKIDLVVIFRRI